MTTRPDTANEPLATTKDAAYTTRLEALSGPAWKRWLDVQRPYRWHLQSLRLGFVLDVGCGLGRNLAHLGGAAGAVGIDHNETSVAACRARGFAAFTPEEFRASPFAAPGRFDALLFSHVLEHMRASEAERLVVEHVPYLRPGGRVVLITPQEAGYASDPTHVEWLDFPALRAIARAAGLSPERERSFPLPRVFGHVFKYNELVVVARKP